MRKPAKFLTKDEEKDASSETLVLAHEPLVVKLAKNFSRNYGADVDDLTQEGNIGLMMAAERFDPSLDVRFSTYALFWVRQKMREFVVSTGRPVRIPTSTKKMKEFFSGSRLSDISLDAPSLRDTGRSIGDTMPSTDCGPDVLAERAIDGERTTMAIEAALSGLNERAADIITRRYLNEDREGLHEIGDHYGISKERVRQIEAKALDQIRKRIES